MNKIRKTIMAQIIFLAGLIASIQLERPLASIHAKYEIIGIVIAILIATSGLYGMKKLT